MTTTRMLCLLSLTNAGLQPAAYTSLKTQFTQVPISHLSNNKASCKCTAILLKSKSLLLVFELRLQFLSANVTRSVEQLWIWPGADCGCEMCFLVIEENCKWYWGCCIDIDGHIPVYCALKTKDNIDSWVVELWFVTQYRCVMLCCVIELWLCCVVLCCRAVGVLCCVVVL